MFTRVRVSNVVAWLQMRRSWLGTMRHDAAPPSLQVTPHRPWSTHSVSHARLPRPSTSQAEVAPDIIRGVLASSSGSGSVHGSYASLPGAGAEASTAAAAAAPHGDSAVATSSSTSLGPAGLPPKPPKQVQLAATAAASGNGVTAGEGAGAARSPEDGERWRLLAAAATGAAAAAVVVWVLGRWRHA